MAAQVPFAYLDERISRIVRYGPCMKADFFMRCGFYPVPEDGVCTICQSDLIPPSDPTNTEDLIIRNPVCRHLPHCACFMQYLARERGDGFGDPTLCPECRVPWYDKQDDVDRASIAMTALDNLQQPAWYLNNQYGAPSKLVHLSASDLVFAIQLAAECLRTSPLPACDNLSLTANQQDGKALIAGMIELARNMNGRVRNLDTICEQLFCRGPKKMVGGHPYTIELVELAEKVAAHATCLYALMHHVA